MSTFGYPGMISSLENMPCWRGSSLKRQIQGIPVHIKALACLTHGIRQDLNQPVIFKQGKCPHNRASPMSAGEWYKESVHIKPPPMGRGTRYPSTIGSADPIDTRHLSTFGLFSWLGRPYHTPFVHIKRVRCRRWLQISLKYPYFSIG